MKNRILILLLIISFKAASQDINIFNSYRDGILYFRDSTEKKGLIKITSDDEIKFKETRKGKKQIYNYESIKKIHFYKNNKTLYYKHNNSSVYLLEKEVSGKIDLYFKIVNSGHIMGANGMMMHGGFYNTYYIGNKGSDIIEALDENVKSREFWLTFSKYIKDCQYLIEKVKDKKSIKKNFRKKKSRLINMVNDYNTNCKLKTSK
ncbi:MAG: hypothetical protein V3V28_14375 [Polaribacter sp.]|uniref:hypothetical protein n=1 Tax=Polaribacter sp. TaxID=1920175 RepID=UPI002F35E737